MQMLLMLMNEKLSSVDLCAHLGWLYQSFELVAPLHFHALSPVPRKPHLLMLLPLRSVL